MAEVNFIKSNKLFLPPKIAMGQLPHYIYFFPTKISLPPAGIPAQEPACESRWLMTLFYDDNWRPLVSSRRISLKV